MTTNDEVILQLKEKIAKQKELLGKSEKFEPVTNCSLILFGQSYNLHALTVDQLIVLAAQLKGLIISCNALGLDQPRMSGFPLHSWLDDCLAKIAVVNRKAEQSKLVYMEARLHELLSHEKRVEMELDDIKKELGE